ncbi:hypothetical protein NIES2100_71680 [Calothrix sp. NIES-2100]|uniref:glycosyltransferase family 39 protein n=1 Tax=Calothrix sp. NIES-2100 TaxID=1954172 RepID=UPI000B5E7789|nr:hypothetical protein NIES2100_71680 [Calothrix sp. NIES-2100]
MRSEYRQWVKNSISSYFPLIAITILGALLRFHQLGKEPLWFDEAATLRFAQMSLSQLWSEDAVRETNPPLYYTLQHFWLVFGQSEAALRSLSAIIGIINIPLLYLLGRILGGHWLGLVASALLATSAINIQYSQEARTYALLTAAATLSISGLAYLLTNPAKAIAPIGQGFISSLQGSVSIQGKLDNLSSDLAWLAYLIGVSFALYCHNTALLLFILANVIALVWWATTGCWRKQFFLNWIVANLIPILLWFWWLPKILRQTVVTLQEFWIPSPTVRTLIKTLIALYGNKYYFLILLGLALLGIWSWRHQLIKINLTITFGIGTILLAFLISLWRPIFITRIFLWTTIPSFVLIAAGVLSFRKKLLIAISLATLLSIQMINTGQYYQYAHKEPWNLVASYIQSSIKSGDTVVLYPTLIEMPFNYYFPASQQINQYGLLSTILNERIFIDTQLPKISNNELFNNHKFQRIWLVMRNRLRVDPKDSLISNMRQKMTQVEKRNFGSNIEVFIFEKLD